MHIFSFFSFLINAWLEHGEREPFTIYQISICRPLSASE
jgi:hypothetical protein